MNRWLISALLGLIVTLVHVFVWSTSYGIEAEYWAEGLWFRIRGPKPPPKEVAIVALDEVTYSYLGIPTNAVPPRRYYAKLIETLADFGVTRVIFDVLFTSPSTEEDDAMLERALKRVPVILGVDSKQTAESGLIMTQQVPPIPRLKSNAAGLALVGFRLEDGLVRSFYRHVNNQAFGSLPTLGEASQDTYPHGLPGDRDLINFYGPEGTIPAVPMKDVLAFAPGLDMLDTPPHLLAAAREKMKQEFAGRTVYVGLKLFTELGAAQKDSYPSPFYSEKLLYGVEIHATVAANLREGNWIRRMSWGVDATIVALLTLLLTTVVFRLRPDWAGIVAVTFIAAWSVTAYLAFTSHLLIPGFTLCAFVLPLSYLGSTLYYYFTTLRSQQQTKKAFEFYLSPEMAEEVGKNPASLALGGKGEYATAMFTDIAGFTGITETMPPEQVSEMLNAYFSEVMEAIFPLKGTLIKFIGDAVFALWGAPLKLPDHALKACQAALAIQDEVEKFNASGRFPALKTRIGVHTGSMVVGNLGSHRRFDFTAIGDSVNLASRVEGVNKYFGTNILVTETVVKEIRGQLPTLLLGSIAVAGKNDSIGLYMLRREPFPKEITELWEKGLRDFRFRRWQAASEALLGATLKLPALETAAKLYLDEIAEYEKEPPPDTWEGTISFSKK